VLHRHFVDHNDYNFKVVEIPRTVKGLFARLERSRWRTYIKAFTGWYEQFDLSVLEGLPKPSFIVTVAHGRKCFAAVRAARYWNVPLVTFFHDWFPASSDRNPLLRFIPDREFRMLGRASSLSLSVSKEMLNALGHPPNSILFPPIPSATKAAATPAAPRATPNIFYSGFCGGAYWQMLQNCIEVCSNSDVRMTISGMDSESLHVSKRNVTILGFLSEQDYVKSFDDADILLVLLNFEKRNEKHFSTHFPSKLIEYCGKGKLVGILGPSYSTSIHWAKETGAAFYYEENDPSKFISLLLDVYRDDERRTRYISSALKIFRTQYSAEVVQMNLVSKIAILLKEL